MAINAALIACARNFLIYADIQDTRSLPQVAIVCSQKARSGCLFQRRDISSLNNIFELAEEICS
jgi:hypothetical protein